GQLKGNQVISIDPYIEELVNAPSTNLKIVMDGRDLKFLDNTFNTTAIFYTLMYIDGADHEKVFNEVKRVLKHGGKLMIWDVNLPVSQDTSKYYGVFRFNFKLPKIEINTGYGARFPKKTDQNMQYYIDIAKKTGFRVKKAQSNHPSFYIELQTPPAITDTLAEIIDKKGIDFALNNYNQLEDSKSNEYYFGVDALISLSSEYLLSDKAKEATEIFKLAINKFEIEENIINSFGYKLLNKKKNKEALEIFKINVKKFPHSSNAYDSLAEAYMLDNQKEPAIRNYQKALELNPNHRNAEEMIKKLSIN
ncbi:MAG: methyltransferase domain-containing protein, partial [Bacteroidales bacterium]|nr:methyltransferase domain-containing protein [Bacteroidales bacterium]